MWKSVKLGLLGFVIGSAWIAAGAAWTNAWAQRVAPLNAVAQGRWQLSEINGPGRMSVCVADSSISIARCAVMPVPPEP